MASPFGYAGIRSASEFCPALLLNATIVGHTFPPFSDTLLSAWATPSIMQDNCCQLFSVFNNLRSAFNAPVIIIEIVIENKIIRASVISTMHPGPLDPHFVILEERIEGVSVLTQGNGFLSRELLPDRDVEKALLFFRPISEEKMVLNNIFQGPISLGHFQGPSIGNLLNCARQTQKQVKKARRMGIRVLNDLLCPSIPLNARDSQYQILGWQQVASKIAIHRCAVSIQWINDRIVLGECAHFVSICLNGRCFNQVVLALEEGGIKVVERDLNLPVNIIFSSAIGWAWYDSKNLGKKTSPATKAPSSLSSRIKNIATNVLVVIRFYFRGCFFVFEGDFNFLTIIMESSYGLDTPATRLEIDFHIFFHTPEFTNEFLISCIKSTAILTRRGQLFEADLSSCQQWDPGGNGSVFKSYGTRRIFRGYCYGRQQVFHLLGFVLQLCFAHVLVAALLHGFFGFLLALCAKAITLVVGRINCTLRSEDISLVSDLRTSLFFKRVAMLGPHLGPYCGDLMLSEIGKGVEWEIPTGLTVRGVNRVKELVIRVLSRERKVSSRIIQFVMDSRLLASVGA